VDFTYPANVSFECSKNCGLCCGDTKQKTRRILLLESEADKIRAETAKPIEFFAKQTANKAPYCFEMKKIEGKCVFLKDNKCTIYELRPLICRFYPFELKFSEDKKIHLFDFTLECPTINKGKLMTKADFEALFLLARERLG
jgi:Fe-S-cluster containining protein